MLIDKELTLDLSQGHPIEHIRFHQGDENSIRLKITLTDDNEQISPTGCTALYSATIRGYLVESDAEGVVDSTAIYIPITSNMTALDGELNIEIKIVETVNSVQQVLYTKNLKAIVERSIIDGDLMIDFSGLTLVDLIKSKLDDAPGIITTSHIKDYAVTAAKITAGAVTATKIASGAVSTGKLGSKAVTAEKIADKTITASKLTDGCIGTSQLAHWAVTADKIENECIDLMKLTPELADTITNKLNFVDLGTIVEWDDFGDVKFENGTIYYISTFVGNMATDIDYGNCWGFCGGSETDLIIVNTSTGYWWLIDLKYRATTQLSDYPKAENILITDSGQNYYSSNLESALLEIAQRIGRKADYESGEITSDNIAWYSDNSECIIQGSYQLTGNYCTLTATATLIDGWGVIFYSLPVACVGGVASTIAVGNSRYVISTTTLQNISTIEIKRLDGALHSVADDSTVSFTITYKYR